MRAEKQNPNWQWVIGTENRKSRSQIRQTKEGIGNCGNSGGRGRVGVVSRALGRKSSTRLSQVQWEGKGVWRLSAGAIGPPSPDKQCYRRQGHESRCGNCETCKSGVSPTVLTQYYQISKQFGPCMIYFWTALHNIHGLSQHHHIRSSSMSSP